MRKLMIALTLAAFALLTGLFTWNADAQTWRRGAVAINAASQNYTPIEKVACYGYGPHCGPGWTWVCNPYNGYCRCRRCW